MGNKETISKWIEGRLYRGYYTFTYSDVKSEFSCYADTYITNAISRLIKRKVIISPTRGFYVIIPVEYALSGLVPATFYIDQMMEYLHRDYYVGLLNAASFYGAAHQRPQTFTVFNDGFSLRNSTKAGITFNFVTSSNIFLSLLRMQKTKLGVMKISCPELTALDLIEYQDKIGGLNRSCTVMAELADSLNFDKVDDAFYNIYRVPTYQRLGFILENVLEEYDIAESLYRQALSHDMKFRKVPFKIGKPYADCEVDTKWKIIINQEIEIDE